MKKISNEYQNKAIELLAQGGQTYIEIAEECGISVDTLRNWRKEPEFQDAVKTRCRELLKEAEPFLYHSALQQIKKNGSHQHIKLMLDRLARLEDIAEGREEGSYPVMFTWKTHNGS